MQYEDSFRQIRDELYQKMVRVPKRRMHAIAKPLLENFNNAFDLILRIEEDPVRGTKTAAQIRYERIVQAQIAIKEIEKPLWVYWNICSDHDEKTLKSWKISQRAALCEKINKVLEILHDMQTSSSKYDAKTDVGITVMRYYTEREIENALFLSTIRDLHRMTHGKIIRLPAVARDADGSILLRFVDAAWYCAVHGNQMRLDDKKERDIRKKAFSNALSALYKAQRPLFNLFSIGVYSNSEIKEWTHLLNESIRLLSAVQKSDRERTG